MSDRIWKNLGIAPTRDKSEIKKAFKVRQEAAGNNLWEIALIEEDYQQALRLAGDPDYPIKGRAFPTQDPREQPAYASTEQTETKKSRIPNYVWVLIFVLLLCIRVAFINMRDKATKEEAAREETVQTQESPKWPVFQQAILDCDTDGVRKGLAAGEDPKQTWLQIPVFCLAVSSCNQEIMTLLLDAGADPHAIDNRGNNSLHFAVVAEAMDKLDFLVKLKIDPHHPDNDGQTPTELARELGLNEIADFLSQSSSEAAVREATPTD